MHRGSPQKRPQETHQCQEGDGIDRGIHVAAELSQPVQPFDIDRILGSEKESCEDSGV